MRTEEYGDYIIDISVLLGKGAFGKIFKCHKKNNPKEEYCAKFIEKNKPGSDEKTMKKILEGEKRAFEELKKIKNENLVSVYDSYECQDKLIIIMELCNHDLAKEFSIIKDSNTWLTQYEQINIIKQILNGAKTLVENSIIHRDIKPQNILVKVVNMDQGQKKIYKISDFGFCKRLENFYKLDNLTRVGTLTHCAPEIKYREPFNAKCDIYSYGILFYQICNLGKTPFMQDEESIINFFKQIRNQPFKFPNPLPQPEGELLMNLIEKMIVFLEKDRINYKDIFCHALFTKSFPVKEESLFMLEQEEIYQNRAIKIKQENQTKQQQRVERIYRIQEIFYRKYLLCLNVGKILSEQIILPTINALIIQQIIFQIGYQQINFALAACHSLWCEIHHTFKNGCNNDMLKLMKIFQNYCEKAKSDQRYQEQQQKIKKGFVEIKQLCSQKLDRLLENVIQEKQEKLFKDSIIQKSQVQKNDIANLCDELTHRICNLELEDWYSKLPQVLKQDIDKISNIEKNQFEILNYQLIDLDEIIKI